MWRGFNHAVQSGAVHDSCTQFFFFALGLRSSRVDPDFDFERASLRPSCILSFRADDRRDISFIVNIIFKSNCEKWRHPTF